VPKFNFSVPHSIGKEAARSRLEAFADRVRAKYEGQVKDVKQSWDGDTLCFGFRTMGSNFEGRLAVLDDQLTIDGSLPFAAMMFKGKIESTIRGELERLLA
jgi:putative polyhydroxyalkanoate system protein